MGSDSAQGARLALAHLFALGHRRVALIAGPLRRPKSHTHFDNYVRAHRERQLPLDTSLVIQTPFTQEGGLAAMQQLLSLSQPPTAVFAVNDIIALGALRAAQQSGLRVPEANSIIGMDDIYAAATTFPPLTTIAKPKYEIGVTAARMLLDRVRDGLSEPARHHLLPCHLIQRSSTAPPGN